MFPFRFFSCLPSSLYLIHNSSLTYLFSTELPHLPTPTATFLPPTQPAHALRARLISWFLDAPAAPFGLHRMVLTGKAAE
jgi:hypothetical protein